MAGEAKFTDEESSASVPLFSHVSVGASFCSQKPESIPIRHCAACGKEITGWQVQFWTARGQKRVEVCCFDCAWDYAAKLDPSYGPGVGHAPATGLMAEPAKILGLG